MKRELSAKYEGERNTGYRRAIRLPEKPNKKKMTNTERKLNTLKRNTMLRKMIKQMRDLKSWKSMLD